MSTFVSRLSLRLYCDRAHENGPSFRDRVWAPPAILRSRRAAATARARADTHAAHAALPGSGAMVVPVMQCRAVRGQRDLAAFAAGPSQAQLQALSRGKGRGGRYQVPEETTFYRVRTCLDPSRACATTEARRALVDVTTTRIQASPSMARPDAVRLRMLRRAEGANNRHTQPAQRTQPQGGIGRAKEQRDPGRTDPARKTLTAGRPAIGIAPLGYCPCEHAR